MLAHCRGGRRWRGTKILSVEMPSEGKRGVTRWEAMQHYKTSERSERDRKMAMFLA